MKQGHTLENHQRKTNKQINQQKKKTNGDAHCNGLQREEEIEDHSHRIFT